MFGHKQVEINRLRSINEALRADVLHHLDRQMELAREIDKQKVSIANIDASVTKLVRDLREMDQLVYQMVQTIEPSVLRSALQRAWAITEARMQAESKRIQAVLIPEIVKTYADHTPQQSLTATDTRRLTKG